LARSPVLFFSSLVALFVLLAAFAVWPQLDLAISSVFAQGTSGFFLRDSLVLNGLSKIVFYGSRLMALGFVIALVVALWGKRPVLGGEPKAWLFLLLALLIGPGLVANVVFKDNWGRARPKQVTEFGGTKTFSRAFEVSTACQKNCSFVSGDAAFGFFLPAFAYVVPRRYGRRVFWGCIGLGSVISLARIMLGAHFASDVLCAALLTLFVTFCLHALMFRMKVTTKQWREWLFFTPATNLGL